MSLHRKYRIDSHETDFDRHAYQTKKPKKHFKSLVTVHLRLISLVPNSATKFDKWTLLTEGYVWSSYLGKAMPCASEPWRLCPQASRALASCRCYCSRCSA